MSEEQFIIRFYSCDNEEQFLKDVYHNLNTLQQENQQLKEQLERNKLNHKQLKDLEKVQLLNSCQVKKLNKKQEQLDLYKSVIDEIREYVKEHPTKTWYYTKKRSSKKYDFEIVRCDKELLEILDKANINGGNENE